MDALEFLFGFGREVPTADEISAVRFAVSRCKVLNHKHLPDSVRGAQWLQKCCIELEELSQLWLKSPTGNQG